jgi:outer membrane protein
MIQKLLILLLELIFNFKLYKEKMKKIIFLLLLSTNIFAAKIGYINIDLLLSESTQFNESKKELSVEFSKKDNELTKQAKVLENLLQDFKENKEDLTKQEQKQQVNEIKKLDFALKEAVDKTRNQFELRSQEDLQKIQDKINDIIKKFAKENKFDLILYKDIAYISTDLDITKQILKLLNK